MTTIIDALSMCEDKINIFQNETKIIESKINRKPKFIIINASNDEGNARYIKGKIREGEKAGLDVEVIKFEDDCCNQDVLNVINKCNNEKIPVILQLPTFNHLDSNKLIKEISYSVDADGFAKEWIGEVNLGNDKIVSPATPKGVISLLDYYNVNIEGKVAPLFISIEHSGFPT